MYRTKGLRWRRAYTLSRQMDGGRGVLVEICSIISSPALMTGDQPRDLHSEQSVLHAASWKDRFLACALAWRRSWVFRQPSWLQKIFPTR